jgi:hypothetical protein
MYVMYCHQLPCVCGVCVLHTIYRIQSHVPAAGETFSPGRRSSTRAGLSACACLSAAVPGARPDASVSPTGEGQAGPAPLWTTVLRRVRVSLESDAPESSPAGGVGVSEGPIGPLSAAELVAQGRVASSHDAALAAAGASSSANSVFISVLRSSCSSSLTDRSVWEVSVSVSSLLDVFPLIRPPSSTAAPASGVAADEADAPAAAGDGLPRGVPAIASASHADASSGSTGVAGAMLGTAAPVPAPGDGPAAAELAAAALSFFFFFFFFSPSPPLAPLLEASGGFSRLLDGGALLSFFGPLSASSGSAFAAGGILPSWAKKTSQLFWTKT